MSFREKNAALTLAVILGVYGWYFGRVLLDWRTGAGTSAHNVALLAGAVIVMAVIQAAGMIVLAIRTPAESRAPMDERERQIDLRATRIGYYVLIVGALGAAASVHLGWRRAALANAALAAVMLAEAARNGAFLLIHRRAA